MSDAEKPAPPKVLSFDDLKKAVSGEAAAIRLRLRLQPAGGKGTKVFPPTYQGGIYAVEERNIDGKKVPCVLLDSVQSQANRLEQALLQAFRDNQLKFPLLAVDFSEHFRDIGEITALDAPHRIADAIFRDSTLNGKPFRPQLKAGGKRDTASTSEEGKRFAEANVRNATPLFELCPTALIFGVWDSTGAAGGLGNKFARVIVSEIVGVNAAIGLRTSSRIDPLSITGVKVYVNEKGDWTPIEGEAVKEDGNPVLFARKDKSQDKGKPTEINHSNVTPDLVRYQKDDNTTRDALRGTEINLNYSVSTEESEIRQRGIIKTGDQTVRQGQVAPGGVTVDHAEQVTVLSLSGLRRLLFPVGGKVTPEVNNAARTALAALALAAVVHQMSPPDYFLRSNCQLVLEADPVFGLVRTVADVTEFTLTAPQADQLFREAIKEATETHKLPWRGERIPLLPKKALVDLVKRSRELGGEAES